MAKKKKKSPKKKKRSASPKKHIHICEPLRSEAKDAMSFFAREKGIEVKDLGTALRAIYVNLSAEALEQAIAKYDPDKKGVIPKENFMDILNDPNITFTDPPEKVIEAFKLFDEEKSGVLSRDQFLKILNDLGSKLLSNEELLEIQKDAFDEEGTVNYEKFVQIMTANLDKKKLENLVNAHEKLKKENEERMRIEQEMLEEQRKHTEQLKADLSHSTLIEKTEETKQEESSSSVQESISSVPKSPLLEEEKSATEESN